MISFWVGWLMGLGTALWWFVFMPWIAERMGVWHRDISPRDHER